MPHLHGAWPRLAVLRPVLALLLAMLPTLASAGIAIAGPENEPGPDLDADPDEIHWTVVGQNAVAFDWRGTSSSLRYGPTTAYGQTAVGATPSPRPISSAGPFWEARLTGLVENTTYHYSIGFGPDHTFRTPPPRGASDFTVYVEGDIGSTTRYWRVGVVQNQIAADLPRFVLAVGDLTYGNNHGQAVVDQHFNDVMVWSQDAAYMPAWGNHEWDPGDTLANYKGRFALPNPRVSPGAPGGGGEDWYWFDYGNVRFIAYPEPWTGAWADWYPRASAVMDSAQSDPDIDWIVTFGHRPAYSSGNHAGASTLRGYLDALGGSHSKYVLNLNGHSHDYERSHPQSGVTHITAGGGGAHLEYLEGPCLWEGGCPAPAWSAFRAMHHGPVRLHFTPYGILGAAICGPPGGDSNNVNDVDCSEGSVMDAFTIGTGFGPNLVANPSFESGTTGWRDYHGSTIARVTGGWESGWALRATGPAPPVDTDFGVNDSPNWAAFVPAAGLLHRCEAWVRSAAGTGKARLQVREYKDRVLVGPFTVSPPITLSPSWQLLTVDYTSVTDSSTLDFQIIDQFVVAGESFDVDEISIRVLAPALLAVDDPAHASETLAARFVPNPLRAAGALRFELPRPGPVAAEILDLQGRRVRTLAGGASLAAGAHALAFDGRDADGARVPPGVYFYRLRSGAAVARGRFLILQ